MKPEYKIDEYRLEIKSLDESGTFEGYASKFGNVDKGGDVVEEHAFDKTLEGTKPITWMHDISDIIGKVVSMRPDSYGLWIKAQLILGIQSARDKYELLKAGAVKGLSIGYDAITAPMIGGVRHLKEIKLYEVALVPFPMNEMATVTAVKNNCENCQFNKTAPADEPEPETPSDAGQQDPGPQSRPDRPEGHLLDEVMANLEQATKNFKGGSF